LREVSIKKACPKKSRPLLTYEKHQVQRYKKINLMQGSPEATHGFFSQAISSVLQDLDGLSPEVVFKNENLVGSLFIHDLLELVAVAQP
jgi:hypothetical protein